jgi:putative GTP pyrophosphokinase
MEQEKDNRQEDEAVVQRMLSVVDNQTAQWAEKKTRELFHLLTHYKCAMMEIESRFHLLNEEYALEHGRSPVSSIKTRLKSVQSIKEKMERKGFPMTPESVRDNLNDIAGVRVICAFPEDVYVMAAALSRQDDITVLGRKDYIAHPKESGYRSLHLIVTVPIHLANGKKQMKVEIQLRTIAMDFWASLEHDLRYKSDVVFTEEMAAELVQCAQLSADLDNRMDRLRKSVQNIPDQDEEQGSVFETEQRKWCET